ncbi:alpha/beta fold hydrolase [Actinoplanes sp. L3-i22]|uniref:alpha/beta fold hydrolase n=1 Tax=Actinoplanes sp. L3-i22 TaxID=2836373 RepID=UPI001C76333E|nr:alpha/beta hydrolase [Actinoplanes sp. L3-i22]BCY09576.1 alpha/beta hydrolase [Actinoplanes sp. L3-i22]
MEKLIDVGAGSVWAEDTGGDLPPVVLLHPGVGDSRIWDPVWARLAGQHRLIRYDVRGFGRSEPPTGRFSRLDDLRRVLDRLDVGPALFAGCSMGGGSALDLALAEPDRVRGMVLACPGISGAPIPQDPGDEPDSTDPDVFLEQGVARWARAGRDPLVVEQLRSSIRFWLGWGDTLADDGDAWSRLEQVKTPSVLLLGDLERPSFVPACVEAARRIPGCRLVEVPAADHFVPLRAPGTVVAELGALSGDGQR